MIGDFLDFQLEFDVVRVVDLVVLIVEKKLPMKIGLDVDRIECGSNCDVREIFA